MIRFITDLKNELKIVTRRKYRKNAQKLLNTERLGRTLLIRKVAIDALDCLFVLET